MYPLNETTMKKILTFLLATMLLVACGTTEQRVYKRAAELSRYIPNPAELEHSRGQLTEAFYAVLDTLFALPEAEPVLHEWEFWFVAADGTPIADCACSVSQVTLTDETHATAIVLIQPQDPDYDAEEHVMALERVGGKWLMADLDGHKADSRRYIATALREQAVREAIGEYLVSQIGAYYLQGELCVPTLMLVAESDTCVFGDFWINWYNQSGDTLKSVSGGNHAGRMSLCYDGGKPCVTAFEQTVDGAGNEASAKRIFVEHYDVYQNIHSNDDVRDAARLNQLREYVRVHNLPVHYYQDYGWDAVEIVP